MILIVVAIFVGLVVFAVAFQFISGAILILPLVAGVWLFLYLRGSQRPDDVDE